MKVLVFLSILVFAICCMAANLPPDSHYLATTTVGITDGDYATIGGAITYWWGRYSELAETTRGKIAVYPAQGDGAAGEYVEWLAQYPEVGDYDALRTRNIDALTLTEGLTYILPPHVDMVSNTPGTRFKIRYVSSLHSGIADDGSEQDSYGYSIVSMAGDNCLMDTDVDEAAGNGWQRGIDRLGSTVIVNPGGWGMTLINCKSWPVHAPAAQTVGSAGGKTTLTVDGGDYKAAFGAILYANTANMVVENTPLLTTNITSHTLLELPIGVEVAKGNLWVQGADYICSYAGSYANLDALEPRYGVRGIVLSNTTASRYAATIQNFDCHILYGTAAASTFPVSIAGLHCKGNSTNPDYYGYTIAAGYSKYDVTVSDCNFVFTLDSEDASPGVDWFGIANHGGASITLSQNVTISVGSDSQSDIADENYDIYNPAGAAGTMTERQLHGVNYNRGRVEGTVNTTTYANW